MGAAHGYLIESKLRFEGLFSLQTHLYRALYRCVRERDSSSPTIESLVSNSDTTIVVRVLSTCHQDTPEILECQVWGHVVHFSIERSCLHSIFFCLFVYFFLFFSLFCLFKLHYSSIRFFFSIFFFFYSFIIFFIFLLSVCFWYFFFCSFF